MRFVFNLILLVCLAVGSARADDPPEPEIWFNGLNSTDFPALWSDTAPWQTASARVGVVVLVHWWVRRPENRATLIQIIEYAKRHHLKIDLDAEAVAKFETESCGGGEGYTYPGEIAEAIQILSGLGVKLDWVDMDEPLWFGSYSTDPVDCHVPIPELIRRTAMVMQSVTSVYPNVRILEIEPVPAVTSVPTWKADETAFHVGLQKALGIPITAMQLDVQWQDAAWRGAVTAMHDYIRVNNMGFGIFYNGSDQATTDADWIGSAINNIETVEGTMHLRPGIVEFTTWNPHPAYNLPETSGNAQTWLINRYVRPLSAIDAAFMGHGAQGVLSTASGKPIAGATVNGYLPGVDFGQAMPVIPVTGVVPSNAVHGLIGVRINLECGGCSGLNNVVLGDLTYQETSGGSASMSYSSPRPATPTVMNGATFAAIAIGGANVTEILATPNHGVLLNSDFFPVTPGASYVFNVPASTIGGAGWFGNIILIWFDANNNEIFRVTVVPPPGRSLKATATTDEKGHFRLEGLPRSVDGPAPVTIEFDGGGIYRSSVWTPFH